MRNRRTPLYGEKMNEPILVVDSLSKSYKGFSLKNVSFSLTPGTITGFIGRNGAGKTTTIKAILGLIPSDSGHVYFNGVDSKDNETALRNEVGVLFGGADFYPAKRLRNITNVSKRFYKSWNEELYRKWLRFFSLDENKRIKELSNGMKVKYALALALSHDAKVLLLDEPTSGLDPVSRDELLDVLKEIAKKKKVAILFSTHVISDLEACADDIIYIREGAIIAFSDLASFKENYRHVRGLLSSLTEEKKKAILHLRASQDHYEGVITKDNEGLFLLEEITASSLEEIMIANERGRNDEESPL